MESGIWNRAEIHRLFRISGRCESAFSRKLAGIMGRIWKRLKETFHLLEHELAEIISVEGGAEGFFTKQISRQISCDL